MSAPSLDQVQQINAAVNAIPYNALGTNPGAAAHWIDAPAPGEAWECRDYTLAKAARLRAAGLEPPDLGVVLCNDELGEYHSVQFARIGGVVWILDNRTPEIYPWDQPRFPYQWLWQEVLSPASVTWRDASEGLV